MSRCHHHLKSKFFTDLGTLEKVITFPCNMCKHYKFCLNLIHYTFSDNLCTLLVRELFPCNTSAVKLTNSVYVCVYI